MEDVEDGSYAPQSPDLSGAADLEPHPQHREYRGSISIQTPSTPAESKTTQLHGFPTPTPTQLQPQSTYFASPVHAHHPIYQHPSIQPAYPPPPAPPTPLPPQQQYHTTYYPPQPVTSPYGAHLQYHPQYYPQEQLPAVPIKQEQPFYEAQFHDMAPGRGRKVKKEDDVEPENNAPGVQEGIEVKTKFPVARIKRIMQADEDVGKVAQVTPVIVSKALELFMISLVTKAAAEAKQRGSKRVLAQHLKHVVMSEQQFDYLQDTVSKVPDAPAKSEKREESDDDLDAAGPAKKKRGSRKKRKDSDEY